MFVCESIANMMGYFNKKVILKYLYDQLTGNFIGFVIGFSATSLASKFFETRSLKNLWGLASKKTVVDKDTFANLEWIIGIIIGFVVFEIITKLVKERLKTTVSRLKTKLFRLIISKDLKNKAVELITFLDNKRSVVFSGFYLSVKNAVTKYSKR
jgi:hypothetical protein